MCPLLRAARIRGEGKISFRAICGEGESRDAESRSARDVLFPHARRSLNGRDAGRDRREVRLKRDKCSRVPAKSISRRRDK